MKLPHFLSMKKYDILEKARTKPRTILFEKSDDSVEERRLPDNLFDDYGTISIVNTIVP